MKPFTHNSNKRDFMRVKAMITVHLAIGFFSALSFAESVVPSCLSGGQELLVNNSAVIQWKNTTPNQYRNRAHIQGTLVKVFPDHSGHHHYEIQIGGNQKDMIEVIYNEQFGPVPAVNVGAQMEACGDYITSNATTGHLPASPDGAIIHWVHKSPNPKIHPSGYIIVNGVVCGQN